MKTRWNRLLALLLALLVCGSTIALAEAEIEPEEIISPAIEASESIEPAEEIPDEAEPAEEAPEALPEDAQPEVELQEASEDIVEIDDEETPLGVAPELEANVTIELQQKGILHFGDRLTLLAHVYDANIAYDIHWEVDRQNGAGWRTIPGASAAEYSFVLSEANAAYKYRVVLTAA